ncbi:MAG: glycosyltransferase family 39 protein [Acidobacteriota bacterium]
MRSRSLSLALAGLLIVGSLVSMLHVSSLSSPVWDEVNFWGIGYYLLHTGRFDIPGALYHPPLGFYLSSLPILGAELPHEMFGPGAETYPAHTDRGNDLIGALGFETFLASRVPFILVYCATGVLVLAWSRRHHGDAGGLFSLLLYLACPTCMANGFLMTEDGLLAFLVFSTLFCLVRLLDAPGPAWLAAFLAALALAPAAKLSGLLVAPLCALYVLGHALCGRVHRIWDPRAGQRAATRAAFLAWWVAVGVVSAAITYAALVLVYQGDWRLAVHRKSLAMIRAFVHRGHPMFLDGEVSLSGFRRYYVTALLDKTPPSTLLAWVVAPLLPLRVAGPRRAAPYVLAAIIVVYFSLSGYTLGLRYALAALPLLHVAAGRIAAGLGDARAGRGARAALCVALAAWSCVEVGRAYPYPRAYTSWAFVHRPPFTVLSDTDLDWGEGLVALGTYVREKKTGPIALSYHGAARPELFGIPLSWEDNPNTGEESGARPSSGLLFVSATNLSGLYFEHDKYAWLRPFPPRDCIGGTIYLYDLDAIPEHSRWLPGRRWAPG